MIGVWRMSSSTACGAISGTLGGATPIGRVARRALVWAGGQLIAGGVGSGIQQDRDEADQLVMGEPVAVVLDADQLGDEVVAEGLPPASDQLLDVGVELLPRLHMDSVFSATLQPKALLMSEAQVENSRQSSRGAPSSAQMIGIG